MNFLYFILFYFFHFISTALQQYFELSPSKNITQERGSSLQIPCKVKNRQGECLWIHNGAGIGLIKSKYEFKRTPDNGKCVLFYVILGQIVFIKDHVSLLTLDKMALFFSLPFTRHFHNGTSYLIVLTT